MSAFPDTDARDAEVLAARRVPREQWRNYQSFPAFCLTVGASWSRDRSSHAYMSGVRPRASSGVHPGRVHGRAGGCPHALPALRV